LKRKKQWEKEVPALIGMANFGDPGKSILGIVVTSRFKRGEMLWGGERKGEVVQRESGMVWQKKAEVKVTLQDAIMS